MRVGALLGTSNVEALVRQACDGSGAELTVLRWDQWLTLGDEALARLEELEICLLIVESHQGLDLHEVAVAAIEQLGIDAVMIGPQVVRYAGGSLAAMFMPWIVLGDTTLGELKRVLLGGAFVSVAVRERIQETVKGLPDGQEALSRYEEIVQKIQQQRV